MTKRDVEVGKTHEHCNDGLGPPIFARHLWTIDTPAQWHQTGMFKHSTLRLDSHEAFLLRLLKHSCGGKNHSGFWEFIL